MSCATCQWVCNLASRSLSLSSDLGVLEATPTIFSTRSAAYGFQPLRDQERDDRSRQLEPSVSMSSRRHEGPLLNSASSYTAHYTNPFDEHRPYDPPYG